MAENSLVTQEDLTNGARLIQELDQAGFPVTVAFWAYDPLLELWRFIIAAPREAIESLTSAYELIQDLINDNGLEITLDRISLIPDDDAKLKNLQALAASDDQDVVEVSVGPTEIAGRVLDDIHLYKNDALRYEQEVIKALQRIQPLDAVMRTYRQQDIPSAIEADAILDDGERVILVEAKARSRPLGARDIFQVEGMLHAYERYLGRHPVALIVSRSGFTPRAKEAVQKSSISLVQWTGPEDDEEFRRALTEARSRSLKTR